MINSANLVLLACVVLMYIILGGITIGVTRKGIKDKSMEFVAGLLWPLVILVWVVGQVIWFLFDKIADDFIGRKKPSDERESDWMER